MSGQGTQANTTTSDTRKSWHTRTAGEKGPKDPKDHAQKKGRTWPQNGMGDTREKQSQARKSWPKNCREQRLKSLLARRRNAKIPMRLVGGVPSRQLLSTGPPKKRKRKKYSQKSSPQNASGIARPQEDPRKNHDKTCFRVGQQLFLPLCVVCPLIPLLLPL